MAQYYQQVLTLNRLEVAAHLGCYAKERVHAQQVELTFRFYYPELPDCASDDKSTFIDYDAVATAMHTLAAKQEFRLIEYMGMQCFKTVRKLATKYAGKDVKIWMKLLKVAPPVAHLRGGASFIYTDLPADAHAVAAE